VKSRNEALLAAAGLALVACSDSSPATSTASPAATATSTASAMPDAAPVPPPCSLAFSNAVTDTASLPAGCMPLAVATTGPSKGNWVLSLKASSPAISTFRVSIDLGAAPRTGTYGAADVAAWDALAFAKGDSNCTYGAGSDTVPEGAFVLTVDWLETGPDGAPTAAHGTLDLQMLVHAPPGATCAPQDVERVFVSF
jgi:hypothetical protein